MSLAPTKKAEPREPTYRDLAALETLRLHGDTLRASIMRHVRDPAARAAAVKSLGEALTAAAQGVMA